MGNLSTPKTVQKLRKALHAKAKAEAGYRFSPLIPPRPRDSRFTWTVSVTRHGVTTVTSLHLQSRDSYRSRKNTAAVQIWRSEGQESNLVVRPRDGLMNAFGTDLKAIAPSRLSEDRWRGLLGLGGVGGNRTK